MTHIITACCSHVAYGAFCHDFVSTRFMFFLSSFTELSVLFNSSFLSLVLISKAHAGIPLSVCLSICLSTNLPTYLPPPPTYLPSPPYPPTYLPAYLPTHPPTYLSGHSRQICAMSVKCSITQSKIKAMVYCTALK